MQAQLIYSDDYRLSLFEEIMFPQKKGYPIVKAKMVNIRNVFSLNRSKVYEFEIIVSSTVKTDSTTVLLGDNALGILRKVVNKTVASAMKEAG